MSRSSSVNSDSPPLGTTTTPLRSNMYDTEPESPMLPFCLLNAERTSDAARLRLSVRHSTMTATPPGA